MYTAEPGGQSRPGRPYNFYLMPILAVGGYPMNVDPHYFTLAAPFEKDQTRWLDSICINIDDRFDTRQYRLTTDFDSPEFGERAVVDTMQNQLHHHLFHSEAKSLAPTGELCCCETRGLLQRSHIFAARHRRIGKETDRSWEEGDDLEAARFRPIEYDPNGPRRTRYATAVPSKGLALAVREIGIRELVRAGCGRRILQKIARRQLIRTTTLANYEMRIDEYKAAHLAQNTSTSLSVATSSRPCDIHYR